MKGKWFRLLSCSSEPLAVVEGIVDVEVMRPFTVCTWSPFTRMIEMDISWGCNESYILAFSIGDFSDN